MKAKLDSTKTSLTEEFSTNSYVKENPYGNAGCRRKIENYIAT